MPEWTWSEGRAGDMQGEALNQVRGDATQTPEFKAWFGDSKVVDKSGRPRVVYHGTRSSFDTVDMGAMDAFREGRLK